MTERTRRHLRRSLDRNRSRNLHHETLEKRELLAAELGVDSNAPRLISVSANAGEQFDLSANNLLNESPRELTLRFDGSQQLDPDTFSAIQFRSSGGDGSFSEGNERVIQPGFLGFADDGGSRIIVARFAETLADDQYVLEIAGYDDTNAGIVGLRNVDGDLFCPPLASETGQPIQQIQFDVEVGPKVVAVVPQPIVGTGNLRTQMRDQIFVYFNDDPLTNPDGGVVASTGAPSDPTVVQPRFYNLFLTENTVETGDDSVVNPESVEYDPALNRAVLTFAGDDLLDLTPAGEAGTFRLRIGTSQPKPVTLAPDATDLTSDVDDTFAGARDLGIAFGSAGDSSVVVSGEIEATSGNTMQWPGIDVPGVRDDRRDAQVIGRADTNDGVNVFYYNFADLYGTDAIGNQLENAITPAQQQRTREILDLYAEHLGVQFIESEDRGLQIVTGDLRALVETAVTGPGVPLLEYRVNDADPTRGVLILDAGENWFDGYGLSPDARPSWFVEALRGVGSLLGIGNTFEQVPGVASGSDPSLYNALLFPNADGSIPANFSIEPDFLSSSDIIPGQALHRPEIKDADLYKFEVTQPGTITVESFAQRLLETSMLDTDIKLWKRDATSGAYELVARNEDFYGEDSFIAVDVAPESSGATATYVVGITATGNDDYNPNIAGSGGGGRSQGIYDLRIRYEGTQVGSITDTNGSLLDGDSDGIEGGDFNFWFRVANTKDAAAAGEPRTLFVNRTDGADLTSRGSLDAPYGTINFAFDQARPGDIVRLLPDAGLDGLIATTADNLAYEIGRGGSGNQILGDGETFEVPRGVTVMIDAGAILKLRNAKISVGSESIDEDRSLAALQVLGTPVIIDQNGAMIDGTVQLTSYNEERRDGVLLGQDTNTLPTTPIAGDWAGVEFRNDFDYSEGRPVWETEGIFLDYVSHADLRYGGGAVSLLAPSVTPLEMRESRPTLIYNQISESREAALSADPNSFLETNFHAPIFQQASLDRFGTTFTSDYDRVGPQIRGNVLQDNSINGLFVRVVTPAVGEREPMSVSGRLDDRDIVHVLSEVLVLQGEVGGPLALEDRPDVLSTTVNSGATPTGTLTDGSIVDYRLTFVTEAGYESLASLPTRSVTVGSGGAVTLANLPAAPELYAGRKLYRLTASGDYEFVAQLDRATTAFTDDGTTRGGLLAESALATGTDERLLARFDARLSIDPGIVIKNDSSRIEATFGADFYAEGVDGSPIVFTSRLDDRYGAGGTFDTNNDGAAGTPDQGDWSGLVFRQGSTASIDHAVISFGGGESATSGGFDHFNAVEILQANVRIANSTIANNADGIDGTSSIRDGIGFNGPTAIFVRGAQPTIVGNVIVENDGAGISINPDALNYLSVSDAGRSTGLVDLFVTDSDNQGPLLAANEFDNNVINGLLVRNESLTTESVWDDTDIVHVVERQVYAWNHHQRGGLRLKSDPNQSLVVKLQDGGSLVAARVRTDVVDSIGGTIQVIGQPGFPVILTSIHDDTVGAGFTPGGLPQLDTDNADIAPSTDWYGITIHPGANDRNVAFIPESERAIATASGENAIPDMAQMLGSLAQNETSSDENRRLGFNVRGTLSQNGDIDVYSFTANGGTEVYFDIDDTDFGLDTIIEVVDVNGQILALSDSSTRESVMPSELVNNIGAQRVLPLRKSGEKTVENPNPLDPGMRVILTGNSATVNQYYVRVRSSNLGPGDAVSQLTDPSFVAAGKSKGQYQLSIRLRETDEVAGSTVRLADIRYAFNAIDVSAAPNNSPLASEHAEELSESGLDQNDTGTAFDGTEGSATFSNGSADPLGSISQSERGALRVSGVLGNQVATTDPLFGVLAEQDIDVYRVNLFANSQEPDVIGENRFVSTVFDIDYADQLGRANTSISVYTATGRLILHSRDSNIADDQGRPTQANDSTNLAGGSAGTLDAYIGPVELQEGTYYVVVSSAQMIPESLNQLFLESPAESTVRILPIDSVRRIGEESFEEVSLGVNSAFDFGEVNLLNTAADKPTITPLFDETSLVPYKLEDVRLFLTIDGGLTGNNQSTVITVDPFTGQLERTLGEFAQPVGDLAMRRDGELYAYSTGPVAGQQPANGNIGNFLNVSSTDGSAAGGGDDGLTFRRSNAAGTQTENDDAAQLIINGIAFVPSSNNSAIPSNNPNIPNGERALIIGDRDTFGRGEVPDALRRNILYSVVANSGAATNQGSTNGNLDRNFPNAPYNDGLGAASNKQELGIVDVGQFPDSVLPVGETDPTYAGSITGIAMDPQQTDNLVFAVTESGYIYSFDPDDTRSVDVDLDPLNLYNRVIETTNHGQITPHPDDFASVFNGGRVSFSSLTLGPRITERVGTTGLGPHSRVLFGVTENGWIYTMQVNPDTMRIEPAYSLQDGNYALPMVDQFGFPLSVSPNGAAFSIREENLWHQTSDRGGGNFGEAHGLFVSHNQSRIRTAPGSSLYFGVEVTANAANNTIEGGGPANGILNPGGAHGSVVSRPMNLEDYSSGDKPTLYFSYFLATEGDDYDPPSNNGIANQQVDAFRVFAAGDDGQWRLLTTNDSYRRFSNVPTADEYDYFGLTGTPVQETFENTSDWRQARVDLSPLAGHKNVQIRFDFSTAGGMHSQFVTTGYLTEIQSVEGTDLTDGSSFTLQDSQDFSTTTFEFVRGAAFNVPNPLTVVDGQQILLSDAQGATTTITLTTGATTGPGIVQFARTDSATDLAANIVAELQTVAPQLQAVATGPAIRVAEANSFALNPARFGAYAATIPANVASLDGQTLEFTNADGLATQVTLTQTPATPVVMTEIPILATDDATTLAERIADTLSLLDPLLLGSSNADQLIVAGVASFDTPALAITSFNQGTTASQHLPNGNVPIFYQEGMTSVEVRDAIRNGLANGIGFISTASGVSRATADNYPEYGVNRIRTYNKQLFLNDSAVGFSTFLPGDEFGAATSSSVSNGQTNTRPADNNNVEGVYIDDILIGFAERGETVYNAPVNRNFDVLPETRTFTFEDTQVPEYPNEILVGGYTLEIRTAAEYGVPEDYDPIRLGLDEQFGFGRSFDTNDRLSGGVTLISPSAADVNDGDLFVLGNGSQRLTFEFDDNGSVAPGHVAIAMTPVGVGAAFNTDTDDDAVLAASIRDAINSPQASNVLGILAAGRDGRDAGAQTSNRVELFGDLIEVNPTSGRFVKVDLVAEETFYGRESARTLPEVDHDDQSLVDSIYFDTFAQATVTDFVNGATDTLVAVGKIGDNVGTDDANVLIPRLPEQDIDIVKIFLNAGDVIDVDIDTVGWAMANAFETPRITIFDQGFNFVADSFGGVAAFDGETADGAAIDDFAAATSGYYYVAVSSLPTGFDQEIFGEYQLTIRPGTVVSNGEVIDRDILMVDYHSDQGDTNRFRDQGQIIIESNFIRDFGNTGIRATFDTGATSVDDDANFTSTPLDRRPGAAAMLRNDNTDRLLPGTVISNNVVIASGNQTGIVFSGEVAGGGDSPAPVPFGRIVNNTVVGSGVGTAINVSANASPTILNNVVSGFNTGLNIAGNSRTSVQGGNAYHQNATNANVPIANSSFVIADTTALFQDPDRGIYIPANGSQVIDSSFASLNDRSNFVNTVKQPVGISSSPIIAPSFDAYGNPRFDDPNVATPGGVGSNVFIDRGGIDRADFVRPVASLVNPVDFILGFGSPVDGGDTDPSESFVRIRESNVEFFEIQLTDPSGTGPDDDTITDESVLLTENGQALVSGVDYVFGYSGNSRTIRLTPLSGLWRPDAVYEITLNNQNRVAVTLPSGNQINDGDQVIIRDLGGSQGVFEFDSGYSVSVPQTTTLTITGVNTDFVDGETFTITAPNANTVTLEVERAGGVTVGNVAVDLSSAGTIGQVRDAFLAALAAPAPFITPAISVADHLQLAPASVGTDSIQLGTMAGHVVTAPVTGMTVSGQPGGITDGQTFTYTSGAESVTFEFTTDGVLNDDTNTAIPFAITNTPDEIAAAIVAAVTPTNLGLIGAQVLVGGVALLGGDASDQIDVSSSALALTGSAGVSAGATAVNFLPTAQFTPVSAAATLQSAILLSSLNVQTFAPGGGTLFISQAQSVTGSIGGGAVGSLGTVVPAITDLAGNPIRETRENNETRFTIIMPEVVFDFGDAGESGLTYRTLLSQDGARHTLGDSRLPRLGQYVDAEDTGQPGPADSDDAPVQYTLTESGGVFSVPAAAANTQQVTTLSNPGTGGQTISIEVEGFVTTFELVESTSNPTVGNIPVALVASDSPAEITSKLVTAIRGNVAEVGSALLIEIDEAAPETFTITAIDDEDGISVGTFTSNGIDYQVFTVPGSGATVGADDVLGFLNPADPAGTNVAVTVAGAGLLDAWVDFDRSGTFDADEQLLRNTPVVDGLNILTVVTPSDAIGIEDRVDTWARFRISAGGNTLPTGVAVGGEVEDYQISVVKETSPIPVADTYSVGEDDTLIIDDTSPNPLLSNDIGVNNTLLPTRLLVTEQPEFGTLTITNEFTGEFTYVPFDGITGPTSGFDGTDTFTYRLLTQGNDSDTDPAQLLFATVTINIIGENDPPVFDAIETIDLLEDSSPASVANVITNAMPGPASAPDELELQTVSFSIDMARSSVPAGLMTAAPDISTTADDGTITFFPADDAVGTATYVIVATDDDPTDPRSTDATITVNVRPVNDPPEFNPTLTNIGETANPDDAYSVGREEVNGEIVAAPITYTLREDNTQPGNTSDPYFIALSTDTSAPGYQRIGLLDVFVVGPANETDATPGGSQTLFLADYPTTTNLGGTLTPVMENGVLIGLDYVPPQDFNNAIGGNDSFTYTVGDQSPSGGETFDPDTGTFIDDGLTATNRVEFNLNPVNDRPEFQATTNRIEVREDSSTLNFPGYAVNINAGPPLTAFDEVDFNSGQNVIFSVTSLGFNEDQSELFFTEYPTVSPDGQLQFRPAPNVFGEFDFEIVATDDGPGNATRGDLISSLPVTLTIDVQPVNDPPRVDPAADPLQFELLEDGTIDILVSGDGNSRGLLDVFLPGPSNESANIDPGGNQSVLLGMPVPAASAEGGSLTPITENGTITRLRYVPRADFTGTDSFIYAVTDDGVTVDVNTGGVGRLDPRIASNTVTLEVMPVNDAPQFGGADDVVVDEDSGDVSVTAWASNVLAGPITAIDELGGANGQQIDFLITQISGDAALFAQAPTASISGDTANLNFTPADDASGVATFQVQLRDSGPTDGGIGDVNVSDVRTFTITVNPVNDAPTYTPGGEVSVNEDSGPYNALWATNVSPGPADEATQSVRFDVSTPAESAMLFQTLPTINDEGVLRFTPAANANGIVELSVTAIDSEGGTAEAVTLRIVIGEVNDPPIAIADTFSNVLTSNRPLVGSTLLNGQTYDPDNAVSEDGVFVISTADLLANDIDPDLDPDLNANPDEVLTIVMPALSFSVSGARVTYDADAGTITYDPTDSISAQSLAPGENLLDSFSYSLRDSDGVVSTPSLVSINVAGVNDAPRLEPDAPQFNPDGPTIFNPLDNDSDVDGTIDPFSVVISFQPANGSISIAPDGTMTYTPFGVFSGDDIFRYTVADNLGDRSEEATVTISVNAAPIARDDQASGFLDESFVINVAGNDEDLDGTLDLTSIVIVDAPGRGQAVPLSDGTIRYVPDPGFLGFDSFQYTIADNQGRASTPADVDVRVVASRLQNPDENLDVNDDGEISAIDPLLVINLLSRSGNAGGIPVEPGDQGPNYYDVNGDRRITAIDAIRVINELNRRNALGGTAQGESLLGESLLGESTLGVDAGVDAFTASQSLNSLGSIDVSASQSISTDPSPGETLHTDPIARMVDETLSRSVSNSAGLPSAIDVIAEDRDADGDHDEKLLALDAAMADLI